MTMSPTTTPQWPSIKGEIKKMWGKLSDSDLEKTHGEMKDIKILLQKNYGETTESYSTKLKDIFQKSEVKKDTNSTSGSINKSV